MTALAALLVLGATGSAFAHGDEIVSTRALDDGTRVELHSHGDPRTLGASQATALKSAMARSAAAGDPSPWLATTWCGVTRTTDNTANEVDRSSAAFHVVYSYPSDRSSRFAQYAPIIQQLMKNASNVFASTGGSTKSVRIDQGTNCGPQYVDITVVHLPRTTAAYQADAQARNGDAVSLLAQDVRSALNFSASAGPRHTMIFGDYFEWTNYGGQGSWLDDENKNLTNGANYWPLDAAIYGYGQAWFEADTSWWPTNSVVHEMTHVLGAVNDGAPHATLAGHCYQQWDIMCYADGGARGHDYDMVTACSALGSEVYDCGLDDYWNPAPGAGSYLGQHWDTYNNVMLCSVSDCGTARSHPTLTVGADRLTPYIGQGSTTTATLSGAPAPVVGYVWDYDNDGNWDTYFTDDSTSTTYLYDSDPHVARVRALLADGRTAAGSVSITARPEAPTVTLTASSQSPKVGDVVHVDAQAAGDATPAAYWSWSDNGDYITADQNITRVWSSPGLHHLTASMWTELGNQATAQIDVSVLPADAVVVVPKPEGPKPLTPKVDVKGTTQTGTTPTPRPTYEPQYKPPHLKLRSSRRLRLPSPSFTFTAPLGSTVTVALRLSKADARRLHLHSTRIALRSIFLLYKTTSTPHLKLPARLAKLPAGTRLHARLTLSSDDGSFAVANVTLVR